MNYFSNSYGLTGLQIRKKSRENLNLLISVKHERINQSYLTLEIYSFYLEIIVDDKEKFSNGVYNSL